MYAVDPVDYGVIIDHSYSEVLNRTDGDTGFRNRVTAGSFALFETASEKVDDVVSLRFLEAPLTPRPTSFHLHWPKRISMAKVYNGHWCTEWSVTDFR